MSGEHISPTTKLDAPSRGAIVLMAGLIIVDVANILVTFFLPELEAEVGRGRATEVLLQRKLDEERARTRSTAEALGSRLDKAQSAAAEARDAIADQLGGMRLGASAIEANRALQAEVAALSAEKMRWPALWPSGTDLIAACSMCSAQPKA
jgi:hypothetical protein